jgi:hypothetical protein
VNSSEKANKEELLVAEPIGVTLVQVDICAIIMQTFLLKSSIIF